MAIDCLQQKCFMEIFFHSPHPNTHTQHTTNKQRRKNTQTFTNHIYSTFYYDHKMLQMSYIPLVYFRSNKVSLKYISAAFLHFSL